MHLTILDMAKRGGVLLLLVVSMFGCATAPSAREESERAYGFGVKAYDAGDYETALIRFSQAVEADPGHVEAHFKRGILLSRAGRPDGAMRSFETVLGLDPNHVKARYNLGMLYAQDPAQASRTVEHLETFLRLAPNHPAAPETRTLVQDLKVKLAASTPAAQGKPVPPGASRTQVGRSEAPKAAVKSPGVRAKAVPEDRSAKKDSRFSEGLARKTPEDLIEEARETKNMDRRILLAREAVRRAPRMFDGHLLLAIAYQRKGNQRSSIHSYEAALRLKPDFVEGHYELGLLLAKTRQFGKATAAFKKVIELNPNLAGAHHALGRLQQKEVKKNEAEQSYLKALSIDPWLAEARFDLAVLYDKILKDPKRAEAQYRTYLQLKSEGKSAEAARRWLKEHGRD